MRDDILGGVDLAKLEEIQTISNNALKSIHEIAIPKVETSITMADAMVNINSSISVIRIY